VACPALSVAKVLRPMSMPACCPVSGRGDGSGHSDIPLPCAAPSDGRCLGYPLTWAAQNDLYRKGPESPCFEAEDEWPPPA
jgi:hypothetical protein